MILTVRSVARTTVQPTTQLQEGEQRFRLSGVPWASYVAIGEALTDWPIRITYDRGEIEFMTTSRRHERGKSLLSRLVEALTEELNVEVESGGSMTFQREDLERGFEPDDCFWIEHELEMRHKDTYDPYSDPPPDLALEVEVSRSLLDRMGIFEAIQVPEVWRWDGKTIHVHQLGPDGKYFESTHSRVFPFLEVRQLVRFINLRHEMGTNALVRVFRKWVREQLAKGWPATETKTQKPKRRRKGKS